MRIFKQSYRDRQGVSRASERWYGEFRWAEKVRRPALFNDRKASEEAGRRIERLVALRGAGGLPDPELSAWLDRAPADLRDNLAKWGIIDGERLAGTKPLTEHLAAYKQHLEDRGGKGGHAARTCKRVERVFKGCGFGYWSDLSAAKVERELARLREGTKQVKGLGAVSINHHLTACKRFAAWMVREGKATTNPLARLMPMNAAADKRHQRRAFDDSEIRALLDAAAAGPVRGGLTGHERYWLYRLAVETGLRASELQSLTRGSLVVHGDNPSVTVQAAFSKRRREDVLPLRQGTAVELREFLGKKLPTVPVFALRRVDALAKGLAADLAAAREAWLKEAHEPEERQRRDQSDHLRYRDSAGRYADSTRSALRSSPTSWRVARTRRPRRRWRGTRHPCSQ